MVLFDQIKKHVSLSFPQY